MNQLVRQGQVANRIAILVAVVVARVIHKILAQTVTLVHHRGHAVKAKTVNAVHIHPIFAVREQEV